MANEPTYTFHKEERICSHKVLEELFSGRHKSITAFPIRAIYMTTEEEGVSVLMSVSKRFFKRAVHRNCVKRQLREAYRLNKHLITPQSGGLCIAFLWRDNVIMPTDKVFAKMQNLLQRIDNELTVKAEDA